MSSPHFHASMACLLLLTACGDDDPPPTPDPGPYYCPTVAALVVLLAIGFDLTRNRILIPQFLRQVASLDGEAMLVGVGDYFEIWSPQQWEQKISLLNDTDANAQRFVGLDLSSN